MHSMRICNEYGINSELAWVAVKFGINTTSVVLEMGIVKFIPISNTTLVVFIPNFTATHAITSTYSSWKLSRYFHII